MRRRWRVCAESWRAGARKWATLSPPETGAARDPARAALWGAVVFAVGFASRAFFVLFAPFEAGDQADYVALARNLMERGTFAIDPQSPTVFRPPGYPFFLALLQAVNDSVELIRWTQAALGAAVGVGVFMLLRRLFTARAALIAALIAAADPHLTFYAATALAETLLAATLTLMACCWYCQHRTERLWPSAAVGLLAGAAALITPRFVAAPLLTSLCFMVAPNPSAPRLRRACACLLAGALVVAPWTARNLRVFGLPIPVATTHPGFSMWLAAQRAEVYDYWGWGRHGRRVPLIVRHEELYADAAHERERIHQRLAMERELADEAWQIIRADPSGFALDRLRKFPRLWIQPMSFAGNLRPPFDAWNTNLSDLVARRDGPGIAVRLALIVLFTLVPAALVAVGLARLLPRWREHALLFAMVAWVSASSALLHIENRFSVVLHPMLAVAIAAGCESYGSVGLLLLRQSRATR